MARKIATLANLVADLASGNVRVVDLTQPLSPDTPSFNFRRISRHLPRSRLPNSRGMTIAGQRGIGAPSLAENTRVHISTLQFTGLPARTTLTTVLIRSRPTCFAGRHASSTEWRRPEKIRISFSHLTTCEAGKQNMARFLPGPGSCSVRIGPSEVIPWNFSTFKAMDRTRQGRTRTR